jgi:tryptophan 2,3-dioxygenase
MSSIYYGDYLQLDKVLNAQSPESDKIEKEAHDEMLFIIVHQAYELWFKQILHEVGSAMEILDKPSINDNTPELATVVHRFDRVVSILHLLVNQIDVIETMTPLDFLDFRDLLRPASGFQSMQFQILETKLGLRSENRYGKEYFVSQLREEDRNSILALEDQPTLIELVNKWLNRMPYFERPEYWDDYAGGNIAGHPFWKEYSQIYKGSLVQGETKNYEAFEQLYLNMDEDPARILNTSARRSALFIMLYRGYPLLHLPFSFLTKLLEIDELMATWRYRHMNMVHRIIGKRVGTGGSTGKDYLKNALDRHYVFSELAELTTFLVERSIRPELSSNLQAELGFRSGQTTE